jgi:hypothetical protein
MSLNVVAGEHLVEQLGCAYDVRPRALEQIEELAL